jgi:uncharacterized protein YjbI with pentapeptide repeats
MRVRGLLKPVLVAASVIGLLVPAFSSAPLAAAANERDCGAIAPAPGADMHRCQLPGVNYVGFDLQGITLARSNLLGANLGCDADAPRTNLLGATMYRVILTNGSLCDAVLANADLHGSELSNVSFEDTTLWDANLSRAILNGATFNFTELQRADLSNVVMTHAYMNHSYLKGADLHGADLTETNFRGSDLSDANLHRAKLAQVDFTDANLTRADLSNAIGRGTAIWSNTTCPDGTNSDTNGDTCLGHWTQGSLIHLLGKSLHPTSAPGARRG